MRRKIVAGNWKMNYDLSETESFLSSFKEQVRPEDVEVMIAPAFTNLNHAFKSLRDHDVKVVAQNMHQCESGAYTGEISAKMLLSVGVKSVILGHSERREYFNETNKTLAEKVETALKHEMAIIFCVGEEEDKRDNGTYFDFVKKQLSEGLFHISKEDWKSVIVAYEPIWAIGTGKTASPEQVQEMHEFIRNTIQNDFSEGVAEGVPILYGGSVKPDNAKEIFSKEDVDGGLIGGASLEVESFMKIINAFK
ncbi:triose-phosphate isomerase [Aequorivita sp. H23M31]|uniref:Triosephosphate isomerase n=1 Tax=Aequorivita ciconiae TaxID=2494375 RepID=A0A410FZB1_9FLAO|nr:triose-phosphate isomerase [Aequorivita sp. H23M31]QAA80316.1 triose-phosphate isomerase [Aequorivita sp. H23M31]